MTKPTLITGGCGFVGRHLSKRLLEEIERLEKYQSTGFIAPVKIPDNVKAAQNSLRSNNSMLLIGENDEIQALQYAFSGLNEILESQALNVAGASEIPVTKLFGRSPAGMNATGESDLQNYYDMIAQQQEAILKPKINKLIPIMFMSEFGYIPDDLSIKFNPIKTPNDDEMAETVAKKVESIKAVYDSGIINQKHAMMELHELSYTTNMFTSITDEDIEKASTDYEMGEMSSFGIGEFGGLNNESGPMGTEKKNRTAIPKIP